MRAGLDTAFLRTTIEGATHGGLPPAKDEAIAHLEAFQAKLDAAQQRSRAAYDALFDGAPTGIALHEIDGAGRVTRVNGGLRPFVRTLARADQVGISVALVERYIHNAHEEIVGIRTTFMQIAGS